MIEGSNAVTLPSLTDASDRELVKSIVDGDKAALKALYSRHHVLIYWYAVRLSGFESTADEVVNDVIVAVWRPARPFEGKSQVATWLQGIVRFKAIWQCRRRSEAPLDQRASALIEDPADDLATSIEKRQRMDILQKCLATLASTHREVIALIYYQGRKIEEVAHLTGKPVSTIKTRLHYARSRMAEALAEVGVDRAWLVV
jgi:RNA polymerase sigma-70 factor (ECF subfamily)